ncbi:hypothetical protein HYS48_04015 [Candidatus Woesearchaeota archaeon]|nr:hypothetical protein [Candidatus Woesearchaeota archaeon]
MEGTPNISAEEGVIAAAMQGMEKGDFLAAEQLLLGHIALHYAELSSLIQDELGTYQFRGKEEYRAMVTAFSEYLRKRTQIAKRRAEQSATGNNLQGRPFYAVGRTIDGMLHAMLLADKAEDAWYIHNQPELTVSRAREAVMYHLVSQLLFVETEKAKREKGELLNKIGTLEQLFGITQRIQRGVLKTAARALEEFEAGLFESSSLCYALQKFYTLQAKRILETGFSLTPEQQAYVEIFRGTAGLREGTKINTVGKRNDTINDLVSAQGFRRFMLDQFTRYRQAVEEGDYAAAIEQLFTDKGAIPHDESFRKFIAVYAARAMRAYWDSGVKEERMERCWSNLEGFIEQMLDLPLPDSPRTSARLPKTALHYLH